MQGDYRPFFGQPKILGRYPPEPEKILPFLPQRQKIWIFCPGPRISTFFCLQLENLDFFPLKCLLQNRVTSCLARKDMSTLYYYYYYPVSLIPPCQQICTLAHYILQGYRYYILIGLYSIGNRWFRRLHELVSRKKNQQNTKKNKQKKKKTRQNITNISFIYFQNNNKHQHDIQNHILSMNTTRINRLLSKESRSMSMNERK